MRFLPHQQDTGGFFVCVLEKVGEIPRMEVEDEEEEKVEEVKEEKVKEEKEESEDDVDGDLRGMVKEDPESANRKYNVLIPWDRKA